MSELKASIVVDFGVKAGTSGFLKAELYDDINPNSPFNLTDQVNFLLFKSANVFYDNLLLSSGTAELQGTATIEKEEVVTAINGDAVSLGYTPTGEVTFSWFGNTPTVTKQPDGTYVFTGDYPFVGKATYNTTGDYFLLTPPSLDSAITEWSILVYILGGYID
jgi:hypothetical protein